MLAHKLIDTISMYLRRNQCLPETFLVQKCESSEMSVEWTLSQAPSTIRFFCNGRDLHWECERGGSGVALEGRLFWINPFDESKEVFNVSTGGSQASKLKRIYGTLKAKSEVVRGHVKASGFDWETRSLLKEFGSLVLGHKRLPHQHGFLCRWQRTSQGATVSVLDHGGILDDNPNVEGHALPARVMAHYYADTYAAYLFLRRGFEDQDGDSVEAGLKALRFATNSMQSYPRGPVWMHNEFKNAGLLECAILLESRGELPGWLRAFCGQLKCDFYQPVNVYALRYYWKTLQNSLIGKEDRGRREQCIQVLQANQSEDGLILDNNPPIYQHARDLTYHQYSLACLAGAIEAQPGNTEIETIFIKGCEFTKRTMLSNGELSYNGRGANNIYHLASALYAFGLARKRFGFEVSGVDAVLERLAEFQLEDGSLPTALNAYSKERMGWNHCRTPYNALSGFLLKKAADTGLFEGAEGKCDDEANAYCLDSGYSIFRRSNYEAVFFSGLGESYVYSASSRTGVGGLAMLLLKGRSPLTLILNRSLRDNGLLATDLPTIQIEEERFEPIGGTLKSTDNGVFWTHETPLFEFNRTYQFLEDVILVSNTFQVKKRSEVSISSAVALALNTEAYRHAVSGENRRIEVSGLDGNLMIVLSLLAKETKMEMQLGPWLENPVKSNPRGRGLLLSRHFERRDIQPQTRVEWAYTIRLVNRSVS